MDLNTKITYRGWVLEMIKYNKHTDIEEFSKVLLLDPSGMAKTWLSSGIKFQGRMSYVKSYLQAYRFNRHMFKKNKRHESIN